MFIRLRYSLGLLLLLLVSTVWAEVPVPALSKRVTDLTATLSSEQSAALENKLASFETRKGSQIAVLILPTTQPETIEAFSIRVADSWKIGRKNIDDGVILLVAKDDRKLRIEVGRGLEGAIPDAIAKRVIAEIITPKFKANDFYGGIDAGVSQLIKLIDGEPLPAPSSNNTSNSDSFGWIFGLTVCVIIIDLVFSSAFGNIKGTFLTGLTTGVISSGYSFFSSFNASDAIGTAIMMFFFGFIVSCIFKIFAAVSNSDSSGSSWSSSGSSFRSSGGGFSSGGSSSWSGGGGGFSGGGASGSW